MFNSPPHSSHPFEATIRTRRVQKKEMQETANSEKCKEKDEKINLPERAGTDHLKVSAIQENPVSHMSYKSSSGSIKAQKMMLEYEAAKAKAEIEEREAEKAREREAEERKRSEERKKRLVDLKLAADLAALSSQSGSQRSFCHQEEIAPVEKVQQWLEGSHISEASYRKNTTHVEKKIIRSENQPTYFGNETTHLENETTCNEVKRLVSAVHLTNDQNSRLMSRIATSKDLPSFDGDTLEWLAYEQAYEESTRVCRYSDAENMWRLRKSLRGEAKETVSALLMGNTSPDDVMEALKLRFGRPETITHKVMQQLKKIPALPHSYHRDIVPFSIKIKNVVATVKAVNQTDYLRSPELVTLVLSKLPSPLLTKWADYHNCNYSMDTAKLETLADFLYEEANKISTAGISHINYQADYRRNYEDRRHHALMVSEGAPRQEKEELPNCKFCRINKHKLTKCPRFKRAQTRDRWRFVRVNRLCHKCLDSSHSRDVCPAPECSIDGCNLPHHHLLHWRRRKITSPTRDIENKSPSSDVKTISEPSANSVSVNNVYINNKNRVLLKIVPINIHGPRGSISTYALLDDGASVSLISADLAKQIDLKGHKQKLCIRGAWDTELMCESENVCCEISSINDNKLYKLSAKIINELDLPAQTLSERDLKNNTHLSQLSGISSSSFSARPEVLIGQDNYHIIAPKKVILGKKNQPCATLTPLGWCVHGVCPGQPPSRSSEYAMLVENKKTCHTCICAAATTKPLATTHTSACVPPADASQCTQACECECSQRVIHTDGENDERLHNMVRKSFMLESIGVCLKPRVNKSDLRAMQMVDNSAKFIHGSWEVGLPWKSENTDIKIDSYCNAYKRLKTIERKINTDEGYAARYKERVHHLFLNDYARILEPEEDKKIHSKIWYLPHFGVDNPNKGKLRLVFDAAACSSGQSLNDYLLPGPNLLESLLGIMLRFREGPVGLTGDIKDMFLRIKIRSSDQHSLRFLWRNNNSEDIKKYVMTSLIFGANCSPFIAQHIKNKNARRFEKRMPEAVNAIIKNHFMDDYIACFENHEDAIKQKGQVSYIHQQGGFEIRNWTSNEARVCESETGGSCATAVQFKIEEDNKGERTLGLLWYPKTDTFGFNLLLPHIPPELLSGETKPTKRELLRIVMSIFDVYGLISPFTIKAKILMQNLWKTNSRWDETMESTHFHIFRDWVTQLKQIKELRIPRWYFRAHSNYVNSNFRARASETLELHVFCDASPAAYAAVAYWRVCVNKEVCVSFIASKCRVAPIKHVTIPRLELQAAVLACRLATTIQLEHTLKPMKRYFWSDSTTVLHWIHNKDRNYNVFVANRLGEMDELTDANEWHYVSTDRNIADVATKNMSYELNNNCEWFQGPRFLYSEFDSWFTPLPVKENIDTNEEKIRLYHIHDISENILPVPDIDRFSSWNRLLRSTAAVLLFIEKCRKTYNSEINIEMLNKAETLLLRHSQRQSFAEEIHLLKNNKNIQTNSRLRTLTPYLDKLGLLRVGGRIGAARDVTDETKNPIILDGRHPVARLITKSFHERFSHAYRETIVNELRQKYWILRLRPTVRAVAAKCSYCRIRTVVPSTPRMADLPEGRLAHGARPFTHCGVDLFGPMEVTVGRRKDKRYGVLFTCMTVRAVHIEMVPTLTTDSFIMALRRMASRRGWPQYMYSDNGTNLRGAEKELRQSFLELNQLQIKTEMTNNGVTWLFNSPSSPHKGGAWERLIRSVKTALKVVLKERAPREETLATLLAEIENIVNSRPLTHVSVDPQHMEALTPNHFLLGTSSNLPVPGKFNNEDLHLRKMWRTAQRLTDMFWQRWVKEVLPTLIPRQKWCREGDNLSPGDVVIIVDPNLPRNSWPRGVVENVYPGKDGRVRTAQVKTKTGLLVRPTTRLALLPTKD